MSEAEAQRVLGQSPLRVRTGPASIPRGGSEPVRYPESDGKPMVEIKRVRRLD